jgi:RNA polymerase sigma factor (sigma-70 family)
MVDQIEEAPGDAEVYARLAPELIAFAVGLVGIADASDVVSGALVDVLAAPGWSVVTNQRAYLYRAVFNEAATWTRRSSRRRGVEQRVAGRDRWDLPTFRPDVRAAVERLSVRQRAVVLLTYWADLDPMMVGELLGISDGSVRRHLARARARLRKVLDE